MHRPRGCARRFAASFVFAWGYFEDIRAFFHVLMLIFLAAMQGFWLTHDLFNFFVWFEVMSVHAAVRFLAWDGVASVGRVATPAAMAVPGSAHPFMPWVTLGLAILIAAHDLGRTWLPGSWLRTTERVVSNPVFAAIDATHDGVIGDYVVWILVGLALFSVSSAAALHAG